jgi:1-hydroxycarotenoid 3,4-desaturase
MSDDERQIVILGAGVGSLALAARLGARGLKVVVVEKEREVGGKMRQIALGDAGVRVDAGPTVLTMRWVFDELFRDAGSCLEDHVELAPLEVLARHWWRDGSTLDLFADRARTAEAIRDFAGAKEAENYLSFCAYASAIYEAVEGPFLRSPMPSLGDFLSMSGLRKASAVTRIDSMRSMWKAVTSHFRDERLRMLFGRYATYTGSSPWKAPATLNTIAAVEQQGAWVVKGGMYALARALVDLCDRHGVEIRTSSEVARVITSSSAASGGVRATGVELVSGQVIRGAAVVTNGDAGDLPRLLEPSQARRVPSLELSQRSLSAVVVTALVDTGDERRDAIAAGRPLEHHNVFFSSDYPREFDEIFDRSRHPTDPTIYLCAQDRGPFGHSGIGPHNHERMLLLANAPATGDLPSTPPSADADPWAKKIFETLRISGLRLRPIASSTTTPREFERLFPSTGGALYGAASHGMTSAFSRAPARTAIAGLYAVGGSAHPGAGVPMVALSASIASRAIWEDLPSSLRSHATAMRGGTSTVSAIAAATR